MTEFLSKLLSPLNLQKRKNGPSLMQGARFNTMQNIIINRLLLRKQEEMNGG